MSILFRQYAFYQVHNFTDTKKSIILFEHVFVKWRKLYFLWTWYDVYRSNITFRHKQRIKFFLPFFSFVVKHCKYFSYPFLYIFPTCSSTYFNLNLVYFPFFFHFRYNEYTVFVSCKSITSQTSIQNFHRKNMLSTPNYISRLRSLTIRKFLGACLYKLIYYPWIFPWI